ncbi:MAG: hypothetical protein HY360_17465 [Verrucomicrobia bacterium]|nr:hypothetical protein [Verrucomicrobiota bacterium]
MNLILPFLFLFFIVQASAQGEFTPPQKDSLVLWLEADRCVETNSMGNATCWRDLSGRENHAEQTQAERQPRWTEKALNGKPALVFDGTNDTLRTKAWTIGRVTGLTVFVVGKHDAPLRENALVAACDGPTYNAIYSTGHDWFIIRAIQGMNHFCISERAEHLNMENQNADDAFHLFSMVFAGRKFLTSAIDGQHASTVRTSIRSLILVSGVDIGGLDNGTPANSGSPVQIAAVAIYNAGLADADRSAVERHFVKKYSLPGKKK